MASCASTRNLPLENCCWWMAKILNIASKHNSLKLANVEGQILINLVPFRYFCPSECSNCANCGWRDVILLGSCSVLGEDDDEGSSDESDDQCMLVITDDKNSLIATDLCQADSGADFLRLWILFELTSVFFVPSDLIEKRNSLFSASVERHAISLLKDSMLRPMTYKPRRPKFVLFRDMEPLYAQIVWWCDFRAC